VSIVIKKVVMETRGKWYVGEGKENDSLLAKMDGRLAYFLGCFRKNNGRCGH